MTVPLRSGLLKYWESNGVLTAVGTLSLRRLTVSGLCREA